MTDNLHYKKKLITQTNMPVFVDIIDIHAAEEDFLNHIKSEWVEWTL